MPNWTTEQQNAITARGGTLLVSAAAGSGKTAVLSERVLGRITDPEHPVDADRLLVLTFSKAAAAEMRGRIEEGLMRRIRENPADEGLKRQETLIQRANISTIHAFCGGMLRQNFQHLGITPDFAIGDDVSMTVLRGEAMAEALEEAYEDGDAAFLRLTELVSPGRDDRKLPLLAFKLYDFMRARPFPEVWKERVLSHYDPAIPPERTVWGRVCLASLGEIISHERSRLDEAMGLIELDEVLHRAYASGFTTALRQAEEILNAAEHGGWDEVTAALGMAQKERLRSGKGGDPDLMAAAQGIRNHFYDVVAKLKKGAFGATAAEAGEELGEAGEMAAALFSLVERFSGKLEEKKTRRNVRDFADLEQLSIRLLAEPGGDGFRRTGHAEAIGRQYDEIFIDEYQDVNEAQEMILRALSDDESNLFMVGDLKQSIYRFRQAEAALFMEKKERFRPFDGATFPAKIILGKNFRSRAGVVEAINLLFSRLMSGECGGVDYGGEDALYPGASYPEDTAPGVVVGVLGRDTGDEGAAPREAEWIAGEILSLMREGFAVIENGVPRPLRYGDCCVLLRSVKGTADIYCKRLGELKIPAQSDDSENLLETREVGWLMALLRAVDNPTLDIPLAAAMLSPAFGFSPDDLAELRAETPNGGLYAAVTAAAEGDERCRAFLSRLSSLKRLAGALRMDEFVFRLIDECDLEAICSMADPTGRQADNLRLFVEIGCEYEARGHRGLAAFVRFLDRMVERGVELESASSGDANDRVRVMSIHKSKGLEFPVCFVAGLGRRFNRKDLSELCLLDGGLGVSLKRRDLSTNALYPTMAHAGAQLLAGAALASEEMRILYVALTRAKQRLFLVGTLQNAAKRLAEFRAMAPPDGDALAPAALREAGCPLEWVIAALPAGAFPTGQNGEVSPGHPVAVVKLEAGVADSSENGGAEGESLPQPDAALVQAFTERWAWENPYARAAGIPVKAAVSDLTHQATEAELTAPAFLTGRGLTAAQRGTALHTFMQYADFDLAAEDPAGEVRRLRELGHLRDEEAKAVDLGRIRWFLSSEAYRRMREADEVLREFRFIDEMRAGDYDPTLPPELWEETILIQGVADCVLREADGIVIIDYKTDRVDGPEELIRRYEGQLRAYARSLGKVFSLPVKACLIVSLHLKSVLHL